ncbi:MAG: hypothetical protein H7Z75_01185 [Ferruginibacter sp.]|nr:hypothetical protein [Cytophagales bacterium]
MAKLRLAFSCLTIIFCGRNNQKTRADDNKTKFRASDTTKYAGLPGTWPRYAICFCALAHYISGCETIAIQSVASHTPMTPKELAAILTALAWPVTSLAILFAFRTRVVALLKKLEESLSIKGIKLKLFGAEIELTPDQADRALNELMQEVVESTHHLSAADIQLFERIYEVRGSLTVQELISDFTRESGEHKQLRKLRDVKLVRPSEGGKWEGIKHPVVTHFAEIFLKLKHESRLCEKSQVSEDYSGGFIRGKN